MHRIDQAFVDMPRELFLPAAERQRAHLDIPLPIGHGQTNSQPYTVRKMLAWLDPQPGERVLDVGAGSGWTTALIARLVGSTGSVVAVERVPELVKFGWDNCRAAKLKNVEFHQAGKEFGWPTGAPYDRILVSAAAEELPSELVQQLRPGGRMVIPIRHSIFVIDADADGKLTFDEHPGFAFVPLVD